MNGEHITRNEFDRYVKMTAVATKSIAESIAEQAKESHETNLILREHTVTNNQKHERTAEEIGYIKVALKKQKLAIEANSKVTSIANKIKWVLTVVLMGALGAYGTRLANDYFSKTHAPKTVIATPGTTGGK